MQLAAIKAVQHRSVGTGRLRTIQYPNAWILFYGLTRLCAIVPHDHAIGLL